MDVVSPHGTETAALEDEVPGALVGAVDDCFGDVSGFSGDGDEEALVFDFDGVTLVRADEVLCWIV